MPGRSRVHSYCQEGASPAMGRARPGKQGGPEVSQGGQVTHAQKRHRGVWGSLRSPRKFSCGPRAKPVEAPLCHLCGHGGSATPSSPNLQSPREGKALREAGRGHRCPSRGLASPVCLGARGPAGALTREPARSLLCTKVWGAGVSDSGSVRALRSHRIKNKLRRVDSRLGTCGWPHSLSHDFERVRPREQHLRLLETKRCFAACVSKLHPSDSVEIFILSRSRRALGLQDQVRM